MDFDSGRVLEKSPEDPGPGMAKIMARAKETGADAFFFVESNTAGQSWCMGYCDMASTAAPERVHDITGLSADAVADMAPRPYPGIRVLYGGPETMVIRTREGGMGILQIVSFTEDPKAVKIRYKMVQASEPKVRHYVRLVVGPAATRSRAMM